LFGLPTHPLLKKPPIVTSPVSAPLSVNAILCHGVRDSRHPAFTWGRAGLMATVLAGDKNTRKMTAHDKSTRNVKPNRENAEMKL
jgi:hypothetical protein